MDSKLHKNTLWLDLLNSDWHDFKGGGRHEDRLDSEAWLKNFVFPWRGSLAQVPLPVVRDKLKELRVLLRRMAEDFSRRKPLGGKDLERLNHILENSPQINKVGLSGRTYTLRYQPRTPGIQSMLADMATSFAEVLVHGEPGRIKICQNPDCLWVFYDNSKNRTRKWCENATGCGNLMKVRMFRARVKRSGLPAK